MANRIVKCPVCGIEFYSKYGRVYCSDKCSRKYKNQSKLSTYNENEKSNKPKKKTKKNKTLTQIAIEAKAAGMSYGEYVAVMEYGKAGVK